MKLNLGGSLAIEFSSERRRQGLGVWPRVPPAEIKQVAHARLIVRLGDSLWQLANMLQLLWGRDL